MFTVDASVHLNALNPAEAGSETSRAVLERLHGRPWPVHSPTSLLVEVVAAVARAQGDPQRGLALSRAIEALPGQIWVPLNETMAVDAARLAAERHLRGADAVYAAVARRHGSILVTRDHDQLERLPLVVAAVTPEQALRRIDEMEARPGESPPLASPKRAGSRAGRSSRGRISSPRRSRT